MSSMSSIYSGLWNVELFLGGCFCFCWCGVFLGGFVVLVFLGLVFFLNAVFVRARGVSMKEYLSFVFGGCNCHNYFPV